MNTTKRFLGLFLAVSLILCVAVSFAACSITIPDYTEEEDDAPATECTHVEGCTCNLEGTPDDGTEDDEENKEEEGTTPTVPNPTEPAKVNYTVMVINTKGAVVSGVKVHVGSTGSKTEAPKTTDANGLAVFTLTESSSYFAQINELPADTYDTDDVIGYRQIAFNNNNVAVLVVEEAVEYKVSVWGPVFADIPVTVYEMDGEEIADEPFIEDVATDENGELTLMLREGKKYQIIIFPETPVYSTKPAISVVVGEDGNYSADFFTEVERDGTAEWPYLLEENDIDLYVAADTKVETWYATYIDTNATLVVNNALATVKIGDDVIAAEEGADSVVVALDAYSGMYGDITFAICYDNTAADEETTAVDVEIAAAITYPLGSKSNPIVVESLADIPTVTVEGGENNVVYYEWIATYGGELIVSWDNPNGFVSVDSVDPYGWSGYYSDPYDGYCVVTVKAGHVVTLEIGTEGSFDDKGVDTPAPAGDITIDATMFVTYDVVLNDANGAPVADFMLEVMDEYGMVIASAYTDMFGRASFKLEEGYYTVAAYEWDVPAGYKCSAETLLANEITVPYFYEFPSSDPTTPSIYDPSEYGYVYADLSAGKTGYFLARGIMGKMLIVDGVNADTVLTLGYVDENGEWVVTATATAVGEEQYGRISIEIPMDPMALLPQMAETRFAITNGSEDDLELYINDETVSLYEGEGTYWMPYVLPEAGDHVASAPMYNSVYFTYTVTEAGTLTVTTPDGFYNVTIDKAGEAIAESWPNFEGTPAQTISANVAAGDVVLLVFATTNGAAEDINFTLTFTATAA